MTNHDLIQKIEELEALITSKLHPYMEVLSDADCGVCKMPCGITVKGEYHKDTGRLKVSSWYCKWCDKERTVEDDCWYVMEGASHDEWHIEK